MVGMTEISQDDVHHLAQLSGLQLTNDEESNLRDDISNILDYVELLGELDTTGVEPTYQVTGLQNVWREDTVIDSGVTREQLLVLSPASANNQVKVPKVL